jgi:hypothetical protein
LPLAEPVSRVAAEPPEDTRTEYAVDLTGGVVEYSELGADTEAVAHCHAPGKNCRFRYVVADEYIPSILFLDARGVVTRRLVPVRSVLAVAWRCAQRKSCPLLLLLPLTCCATRVQETYASARRPPYRVLPTLPAVLLWRFPNRGVEAMDVDPSDARLWFMTQSPLALPDAVAFETSRSLRLFMMNVSTETVRVCDVHCQRPCVTVPTTRGCERVRTVQWGGGSCGSRRRREVSVRCALAGGGGVRVPPGGARRLRPLPAAVRAAERREGDGAHRAPLAPAGACVCSIHPPLSFLRGLLWIPVRGQYRCLLS